MFELKATTWLDRKGTVAKVEKAALPRLVKCGYLVEGEMKRLLSEGGGRKKKEIDGKSGKTVTVSTHEPSAPGQPPHLNTGNLRSSIKTAKTPEGTVIVGPTTTAWYGQIHEFGGRHHPKRPFARPALANMSSQFPAEFGGLEFEQ